MELDGYLKAEAAQQLRVREQKTLDRQRHERRELITNCAGALAFLLAATLLAVLAPWQRSLTVSNVVLVLFVWVVVERVKFPVASYWTHPTMLAFVPALFLLPTPAVPLIASLAILMRGFPGLVRGRVSPRMLPVLLADGWFTIGPALVIVLGGAERFSWSHWPIYVAALVAEVGFDLTAMLAWPWIGEHTGPKTRLLRLNWTDAVDAALAPLGLLIASEAVRRPGLLLIALSPTAMFIFFARERKQRTEQTQALSTAYRGTALLLGELVEADDHYTGTHSRDVVDLSLAVADGLRLDSARRRDVEFAALLHDVGKMRVSKDIINKRGPLDPAEWEVIRRHTIDGELMLRRVGGALSNVGRIVRSSHERFDGAGYPDGLAGEAIPLEARIVSVCDSYSAMTTDRPYRAAMSVGQAVAELHRCAGSQFDPDVVLALTQVLGTSSEAVPEPAQTPQASSLRAVFSG